MNKCLMLERPFETSGRANARNNRGVFFYQMAIVPLYWAIRMVARHYEEVASYAFIM